MVRGGTDLGTRSSFADVGQTIAAIFDLEPLEHGQSFLDDILR
jgi:phosphopentomutase